MYVFQVQSSKIISVENKFKNVHDSFCPFLKKIYLIHCFLQKFFTFSMTFQFINQSFLNISVKYWLILALKKDL